MNSLAALGLLLIPFGNVTDLVKKENPWHGFEAKDPVLTVVRAEQISQPQMGKCESWLDALKNIPTGVLIESPEESTSWKAAFAHWEPWNEDDLDAIISCAKAPCKVKLNSAEAGKLKEVTESKRFERFLSLVEARALNYRRTLARPEYEFRGALSDPWALFEGQGFKSPLKKPDEVSLWVSRLDLAPKKMRVQRQLFDRRIALANHHATLWIRDAYTDHYFDGWGEWIDITCDPTLNQVLIVQALIVEFDLLKATDLISLLSKGRMRSVVEEQGGKYLDNQAAQLRLAAQKNK